MTAGDFLLPSGLEFWLEKSADDEQGSITGSNIVPLIFDFQFRALSALFLLRTDSKARSRSLLLSQRNLHNAQHTYSTSREHRYI